MSPIVAGGIAIGAFALVLILIASVICMLKNHRRFLTQSYGSGGSSVACLELQETSESPTVWITEVTASAAILGVWNE
jgi:hypothetical protein